MKTIRKRSYRIDLGLLRKHVRQHRDCLNADIQRHLNDYDHEGDYGWRGYLHYWYCAERCSINGFCWYCGESRGDCVASDFESTDCRSNCTNEFKSDFGEILEAVKGRNSQGLRGMNINRLSHFYPPFFVGGGLTRPRHLLKTMMSGMSMTDTYQQIGIHLAIPEQ